MIMKYIQVRVFFLPSLGACRIIYPRKKMAFLKALFKDSCGEYPSIVFSIV